MHDWNDLRYFLELARAGRLLAAAQRLRVDHTTVARRIAALELALGVRLFDKSPRGYALTEAGHQLLPQAEAIEARSIQAFEQLSGQDAHLTGTVRLATTEAFGTHFLVPRLPAFYARYPGIDLELVAESRPLSLSKREADALVTLSPPQTGRLITQKLTPYTLSLYASRSYLEQAPPLRSPTDLPRHKVISYIEDLVRLPEILPLLEPLRACQAVLRSTSVAAQQAAVAAGIGLGLLHDFAAAGRDDLVKLLPGQISGTRDYWLVVPEDLRGVARIDAVCRYLVAVCRAERAVLMAGAADLPAETGDDDDAMA
jgi:DNA-binding transcriptional LysR family regulator